MAELRKFGSFWVNGKLKFLVTVTFKKETIPMRKSQCSVTEGDRSGPKPRVPVVAHEENLTFGFQHTPGGPWGEAWEVSLSAIQLQYKQCLFRDFQCELQDMPNTFTPIHTYTHIQHH